MGHNKDSYNQLFRIAETQRGYFTTKQAIESGFPDNVHSYHVKMGNWIREHRGIYRLLNYPQSPNPDLIIWSLWSRNRDGEIEGIYSHQTALSLYELSDLNPSKLHMTVPVHFRRMAPLPKILVLHKGNIKPSEISQMEGFQTTKPFRTIVDLIEDGKVEEGFIKQAIKEGFSRGLIRGREIDKAKGLSYTTREKLQNYFKNID